MPSSPFRDEGAPCKVMRVHSHESAIDPTGQPYIKAMLVITSDLSGDQGREFRVTDGDMVRLSHMTAAPTPPDFDAALERVLRTAAKAERGIDGVTLADVDAARQRVRDLYEAVERERDELRHSREMLTATVEVYERAAQQGEVCRVVEIYHDRHPTISITVPTTDGWHLGQRVRITKIEEGA